MTEIIHVNRLKWFSDSFIPVVFFHEEKYKNVSSFVIELNGSDVNH